MNRKRNVSMRLVALLCTLVLMVGLIPASALPTTAKLGGDFPWTSAKKPMLIEEILEQDGGMTTLSESCRALVLNGTTTVEEARRVTLSADYLL